MKGSGARWTRDQAEKFVQRTGNQAVAAALRSPAKAVLAPKGVETAKTPVKGKKRREMNKTETEFSLYLQKLLDNREIDRFGYEEISLRWPDGMRYCPDFVTYRTPPATYPPLEITMIEVKGSYCWKQDLVKFRAARAYWPMFTWEFWQKVDGIWQQTR